MGETSLETSRVMIPPSYKPTSISPSNPRLTFLANDLTITAHPFHCGCGITLFFFALKFLFVRFDS